MNSIQNTPKYNPTLSAELRNVIHERNILTTKTKMKVLTALDELNRVTLEERKDSMRSRAIQEVLTSEVSYLHQLELIMKYFMDPIREKNVVKNSIFTSLFGNIETIYQVNGELLKELKQDPENIASAFLKLAPFFKLYSVYAYDYKQIIHVLQESLKTNTDLNILIERQECRPEVGTKLSSLLITPIQRIPRYRLLLKEVLAHTSPTHADFAVLQASLVEVERTAEHINSLVQDQENMQKMIEVQRSLCGSKPKIVAPGRKLIKEGMLMKVSPEGRKAHSRYFLLFSDMIMYCKILRPSLSEPNSLRCCCILPLKDCHVDALLSKDMFKVTCHNETLILYSATVEEGEKWVKALKAALKQFHENRQTLRKDSSSRRPMRPAEFLNGLTFDEFANKTDRKRMRLRRELDDVYQCDEDLSYQLCGSRFQNLKERCQPPWKNMKLSCLPNLHHCSMTSQSQQSPGGLKDSLYPLRSSVRRTEKQLPSCTKTHRDRNNKPSSTSSQVVCSANVERDAIDSQSIQEAHVVSDPTLNCRSISMENTHVPNSSVQERIHWPLFQFQKMKKFVSETSRSICNRLMRVRRNSI